MSDMRRQSIIQIEAPARLHLGFLDLGGSLGRTFGGIGLAINQPFTRLTIQPSKTLEISGGKTESSRIEAVIAQLRESYELEANYHFNIEQTIPPHSGLGSGTQTALAAGVGVLRLEGYNVSAASIAGMLGRGARSAIGIGSFDTGGFIVDGGRRTNAPRHETPPILMGTAFPEDWRTLLVLDQRVTGAHGEGEQKAFASLPSIPENQFARISHLVLMQLVPSIIEKDIQAFGAALTEIQYIIGKQFAPVQSGCPWTSPAVGKLVKKLQTLGAYGIGQSSWGPTGFAFAESPAAATHLHQSILAEANAEGLVLMVTSARNRGARIDFSNMTKCVT